MSQADILNVAVLSLCLISEKPYYTDNANVSMTFNYCAQFPQKSVFTINADYELQ